MSDKSNDIELKAGQVWESDQGERKLITKVTPSWAHYETSDRFSHMNRHFFSKRVAAGEWRLLDGASTKPWPDETSVQADRAALIRAKLAELEAKRGKQAVATPWDPEEL